MSSDFHFLHKMFLKDLNDWELQFFPKQSKTTVKQTIEMYKHPERFCKICHKRTGVCKHTRQS